MPYTDKYNFEEVGYGVSGWNGIMTTNMQLADDAIQSRVLGTIGENVSQYDAVAIHPDEKYWKSPASGTSYPTIGLMYEAASAEDVDKRIYIKGEVTNASWGWTVSSGVYTSATTPGELTQTLISGSLQQFVGTAVASGTIILATDESIFVTSGGIQGVTDHGTLTGLSDDDHTIYSLVDGTRSFTGAVLGVYPTQPLHLATMSYVDTVVSGVDQHNELGNLDYASAGHTGFVSTTTLTTVSGDLVQGYTDADTDVTNAFISADTTLSGELYAGYVAADVVVTDAFVAADTTLSGELYDQLHDRSHAMTDTSDHTGGTWKVIYSDGSGDWQELPLGVSGTVLTSQGTGIAPVWV